MSNPFASSVFRHFTLVFNLINDSQAKVLDYGCGNGNFTYGLSYKIPHVYGYDVDPSKISEAKSLSNRVNYTLGKTNQPLPYSDSFFDIVTMFHVLEHVDSEERVLAEVYRVLKNNGLLYLASPYHGLFAWADAANVRFRFPKLHRWFFETFLGKSTYRKKFAGVKTTGLSGDCTATRNWHKHYTQNEIIDLMSGRFKTLRFYKFSLFYPFLLIPYNIINFLFMPKNNPIVPFIQLDNLISARDWSYNFIIIVQKK